MTFQHSLAGARIGRQLFDTPERAAAVLRAAWPGAVGPELARRTEVVALEGRCLWVRVPDVGWRRVLHRMRGDIRRRLRQRTGDLAPSQLAFVLGPLQGPLPAAPQASPAPPEGPAGPAPTALQEASASIPDPELRRLFLESASRYLSRTTLESEENA